MEKSKITQCGNDAYTQLDPGAIPFIGPLLQTRKSKSRLFLRESAQQKSPAVRRAFAGL